MKVGEKFMVITQQEDFQVEIHEELDRFVAEIWPIEIMTKPGEPLRRRDPQPIRTFEDRDKEKLKAKCKEWIIEEYGEINECVPYS